MREGVAYDEIVGCFENVDDDNEKIRGLKTQIKALSDDINEIFKSTAKDFECRPKDLRDAYKKYIAMQEGDDDDDFYTLVSLIQQGIEDNGEGDLNS